MATKEDPQTEETKEMEIQPRRRGGQNYHGSLQEGKGINSEIKLEDNH